MVLSRRHIFLIVGLFILISFSLSFQWISVNADYLRGLSNFGIFRQHVDPLGLSHPSPATTSAPGTAPKPIRAAQRTRMVDGYLSPTDTAPSANVTHFKVVFHESENIDNATKDDGPQCPEAPPNLIGPLNIDLKVKITIDDIIAEHGDVNQGGHSKPAECTAQQRIAIVLPFRNRETHLKFWLYYLLPILKRQQGDYGIYVIEQFGDATFNRAKLMNVGFSEAQKEYDYNCFIFSDIDIIPMDDRNLYRCGSSPRHMANAVDKFGFSLPYDTLFGGVVAFSKDQFLKINGYSNVFWGWGGEDDELYNRVVAAGMKVERPNSAIARSKMIVHNRDSGNESNGKSFPLIGLAHKRMQIDGLRTIQYKIVTTTRHQLYTKITVDLGKPGT